MIRKLGWLIFLIRYKLGLVREGVDVVTPGLSDPDGYWDAVADNCPEFWDDELI